MRLSTTAREKLYDSEAAKAAAAGRGDLPICNICDCPIDGRKQGWDVSHDPAKPGWLGGEITGIAHRRCNRLHNNQHDTPLYNKTRRQRQADIGARVARTRPMEGGRSDWRSKKMDGTVIDRRTGEPVGRGR